MPQQQGSSMSEAKPGQRFHSLNAEQVEVLHQVLSDVVPIHGRGNFPTLELRPRDIIIAVRARLQRQGIHVRDVRLNGSTASHVLVCDNGTSYKDLDIIFGVELPSQEEFQVIKEAVLGCLLDCLPTGVNKERISSATMKEAYVQKMVKVFNEHDRWSLISLSNNSGKNLELKFVSLLRRQFEFSVDSFQIILDRLLESYMAQDLQRKTKDVDLKEHPGDNQNKQTGASPKQGEMEKSSQTTRTDRVHEKESQTELSLQNNDQTKDSKLKKKENFGQKTPAELKDITEHGGNVIPSLQTTSNDFSKQQGEIQETESETLDKTERQKMAEHSVQICPCDDREALCSNQELCVQKEPSNHSEEAEITEKKGQFELPEISDKSGGDLAQEMLGNGHSDEGKCSNQERSEDENATSTTEAEISLNAEAELHTLATDQKKRAVESKTGEKIGTERVNDSQESETNEGSFASETQHKDTTSSDSSCSTLSNHQAQSASDTLEIPHTLLTESAENTQDNLLAPSSLLLIDKKTSKASERLSYMVVLKHSSPKPPRRMCRKVSPTSIQQNETIQTSSLDPSPCPSPEPEETLKSNENILDSSKIENHTSSTNVEPSSDLTSSSTDLTPNSPLHTCEKASQDSPAPPPDQQIEPITVASLETASAAIQSDPPDLQNQESSEIQKSIENTSEVVLSDAVKKIDVDEAKSVSLEINQCAAPPVSCLAPPILSFSAPCYTPSPPSLSPPPCITPPSLCINTVSPSTSFSSAPLSFSPTSSCLSSPPYLTPPMLSLSPPPSCLSPPLLCLTPPVDSADLVAQVSTDVDMPLILDTDSNEQQSKETATQQAVPLLETVDEKQVDYISTLPQGSKPVSFPITIPNATTNVLPQSIEPVESAAPIADVAPIGMQESKILSQNIMPEPCLNSIGSAPDVEVLAESMYGDFEAAMDHLRYRLIATRNPEEIRGGGLLKYSNLLVRDYRPASETQIKTLERYMCSRFFIDFPDVQEQQRKILSYLKNHFIGEERSKYQYLMTLRRVVDDSTVCLMGHERRQTLNMITVLALKVLGEQNIIPNTDHVTCFYQPAPYITEPSYCSYYIPQGGSALLYQPYPLHLHSQTGLV
ncbi:hypothetical protein NQD34_007746 [Periophthalmus magnuspinnatus]|nr:hypothetical protein NQD34_007746 [Periophthalmus magnuspinnatus]